ncbi:MAG: T9SS type A sorting domain-containing protein [Winogradskyella sp.]|uniref:T9SS type A sorting domain-containing protein n=1 Tax=Winogradskyella sp. TaxID=1883156 RepID=UPI003859CE16
MANKVLLSVVLFLFSMCFLEGQTTIIPDANFENYLETHSADGAVVTVGDAASMGDGIANNSLVLTENITDVLLLDVSGLGISDLTGIEDFLALENLFCSDNNIESLNITSNINVVSLLCGSNSLAALDLSNNANLETLNCADNQIQNLDISNNLLLKNLTASGNQLTAIDVSNHPDLALLSVSNNRITGELVLNNNPNLESLFCASNQITTLNLAANTVLKNIDASNNALTTLDLTTVNSVLCPDPQTDPVTVCQGLGSVNVSRNQLTSLVVTNGFNDLFSSLNATENPDLFCIQIDAGFTPTTWLKDDWTYYSENACVDIYTYVPDDNFEQALINLGIDTILDNLVLTANINMLTDLNVSNAGISSLVGIEDFLALENLDCSTNSISDLDLRENTALQQIDITNNDLTTLDVSENTALTTFYCASNFLETIDLSNNTSLIQLNCSNNTLTALDVTSNVQLTDLDTSFNGLESLDITNNTWLVSLLSNNNNLFALNSNNGSNNLMTTFNATNNTNLFCIQVDDVAFSNAAAGWQKDNIADYNVTCGTYIPDDNFEQALIDFGIDSDNTLNNFVPTADINALLTLDISGLGISDFTGIEDFTALQNLNGSNNNLTSVDFSFNLALQILDMSNNEITNLDLTANTALTTLRCHTNALLTLNIENGNNNLLTFFDATNNPNLFCINIDDAIVGNTPAAWQKDEVANYNGDCENTRFTAIPDAFFEQALIDLGYDDVIDNQVLTANIEHILNLNVNNEGISDLTGIQDFKSLIELDCSGNYLETLDVSNMAFLERLNCSSNFLMTNDINDANGLLNTTGTTALKALFCANNNLNNLDTSQNTNLEVLDCADNNLSELTINNNAFLRILNCSNNGLMSLDISSNPSLETVNSDSNQLTEVITLATNNTTLTHLSCANNDLPNLLVANYEALTNLNASANDLTQLNVTSNSNLSTLSVSNNELINIDLSNNANLVAVLASQNNLAQLDVAANTVLERLNVDFNNLTELDLNSNAVLEFLATSNNQLTILDVSNNANLIEVNVSSNQLSSLILNPNLGTLKQINVSNNQLEGDLDLTTMALAACVFQQNQTEFCPETIAINLSNNLLSFVNIQNGINTQIANFNATGNPNLECIQVDDVNTVGTSWIKDEATDYNEDCNFGETFVPDDNFEQALIDLGYDVGPLNDYVLTATIEVLTNLDVSGSAIADLTGIEDFTALTNLNVSNNLLNTIDISKNTNLVILDCSNNLLTDLDLATHTFLERLDCSNNTISSLDFSTTTNLSDLNISENTFTSFLPSDVPALQVFNSDNNAIVSLDFQQNQFLTSISCQFNALETLNIKNGQNAILTNLNAVSNPDLLCVETDNGTVPSNATWTIDVTAQFAIDCFFGQTFVPDDNFEQALIDFGYDAGPLDDYVFTENIEDVTFLNLNAREISDLTGIEDFINLTNLNFEDNTITAVDLSANLLLVNLDASGNLLLNLDLSLLSNLVNLDVSNNEFVALNFEANLLLSDIDVSNNLLTNLEVAMLPDLEDLNCAANQLSSLNVTQNPNLRLLFCQSNLLIADQLNIQNGNNENLQVFNATNNPDLGCILVDDPVAVISNTEGIFDNWLKDDSATYQVICDDVDNDGVPNEDDLCPNTDFGAVVDFNGCATVNLPNDNFTVLITGETCLNSNNGKITITAQEIYSYTATLTGTIIMESTGEVFYQEYNFTNDVDIFNLLADTYRMCITIEEWPDYEICYTVVITQPDPLLVFASRPALGNDLNLDLAGSTIYHIEFNGDTLTTHNSTMTLPLQQGLNTLKVSTDLECQGIYEEKILLSDDFLVYPNPFRNQIHIYNGSEAEAVELEIYSVFGPLVLSKTINNHGRVMEVDTSPLAAGMYLISVKSKSMSSVHKMIKE